jgi:hypothetical protein
MARFGMKTRDLQPPKPSHRPFVCPVRSPALTGALRGVRLPLEPPWRQRRTSVDFHRGACSATTSGNVSQSYPIVVLAGFPKPRVAGSIPAGGTIRMFGST